MVKLCIYLCKIHTKIEKTTESEGFFKINIFNISTADVVKLVEKMEKRRSPTLGLPNHRFVVALRR